MEVDSKNPLFFERVFFVTCEGWDRYLLKVWRGSRRRMTIDEQIDILTARSVDSFRGRR